MVNRLLNSSDKYRAFILYEPNCEDQPGYPCLYQKLQTKLHLN
jgi:hypothetical protein